MSKPLIIGFPQSTYVWTARAALAHKGVDYDFSPIAPPQNKAPEHLARHPWGKVPVFEHGDLSLYETTAICTYVDMAFEGPELYPSDTKDHARAVQLTSIANAYLYPDIVINYALQYIFAGPEGPNRATIDAALPKIKQALGVLEAELGERKWLVGEQPCVGDYFVGPLIAVCGMFPEGKAIMAEMPQLSRLVGQLMQIPAFAAGAPPR